MDLEGDSCGLCESTILTFVWKERLIVVRLIFKVGTIQKKYNINVTLTCSPIQ
jgi:hypothetical protein